MEGRDWNFLLLEWLVNYFNQITEFICLTVSLKIQELGKILFQINIEEIIIELNTF